MTLYGITLFENEDRPQTTVIYTYTEYMDMIASFERRGYIKDLDYTVFKK